MTKIINGRIYTHQTKEDPPKYYSREVEITGIDQRVFILLSVESGVESVEYYTSNLQYTIYPSSMDLISIPEDKYIEGWINVEKGMDGTVFFYREIFLTKEFANNFGNYRIDRQYVKRFKTLKIRFLKDKI
jgi:hypothetical protein